MKISATQFRKNLYRYLDAVAETGIPLEITRGSAIIRVVVEKKPSKLANLKKHSIVNGDPRDLIEIDWLAEWDHGKNLK